MGNPTLQDLRDSLKAVEVALKTERDNNSEQEIKRVLSIAITHIENGDLWIGEADRLINNPIVPEAPVQEAEQTPDTTPSAS